MTTRLRRAEQVERNRELLLAAAREVFLERGYAGASLESVAEHAGFSKGVVYSQFGSKVDLFMALLGRRIAERSAQNERLTAGLAGAEGVRALLRNAARDTTIESGWARLLVEFRAVALRDPAVNRRYAEAHERTLTQLAAVLGALHDRAGLEPAVPLRAMAELIMALASGLTLERAANPAALSEEELIAMVPRALGLNGAIHVSRAQALRAAAWTRLRTRLQSEVRASLPEHVQRLTWSREQIDAARRDGLRRLLAHAARHSPFHARRLAGVDLDAITPGDLSALPVMTKGEMMGSLDDVFTDRRLSRRLVERALVATTTEPVPILDAYTAFATGGSSGERGLFVFDLAGRAGFILSLMRALTARLEEMGGPPPGGLQIAFVGAASAVHPTAAAAAETEGGELPLRVTSVPVTLPLNEIVSRLNELRLPALFGYPSMLVRLADERRTGRLQIKPQVISSTSETLTPEARRAISTAFGVRVVDTFATTEGLVGTSAPGDRVMTFNSELCIAELVDGRGRPVAPGAASAKVLLTNLYNLAQPLIRYELCDVFVRRPDAADHGHMRACVEGRAGEVLRYGTTDVHAHVVRSELVGSAGIIDYQVRQTVRGMDVDVIAPDGADAELADRIAHALAHAGMPRADVRVRVVAELERDPQSGKLRRLVQLPQAGSV